MASLAVTLLIFIAAIIDSTASAKQAEFTSTTGKRVPLSLIKRSLPSGLRSDAEKRVFEYDEESNTIVNENQNISVDLNLLTNVKIIKPDPKTIYTLNGKSADLMAMPRIIVKSNDQVSAVYSGEKLISVDGYDFLIRPIEAEENPELFVNVFQENASLDDDGADNEVGNSTVLVSDVASPDFQSLLTSASAKQASQFNSNRQVTGTCASGTKHWVELVLVYDNRLCAQFGNKDSDATTAMLKVIDTANAKYTATTCLELVVNSIEAHCNDPNDPYASISGITTSDALVFFMRYWELNRKFVRRDIAQFFTGYDDGTSTLGVANFPSNCADRSYGINEGFDDYVFTHELGHNMGSDHTAGGLMLPSVSQFNRANTFFFNSESITQIANFIDNNPESSCLATSNGSCDSQCPVQCTGAQGDQCIKPATPGPGLVGCSRVEQYAHCGIDIPQFSFTGGRTYQEATCDPRFPFVLRPYDANDPLITCCRDPGSDFVRDFVGPRSTTSIGVFTVSGTGPYRFILPVEEYEEVARFNTEEIPSCTLTQGSPNPAPPLPSPSMSTSTTATSTRMATTTPTLTPTTMPTSTTTPTSITTPTALPPASTISQIPPGSSSEPAPSIPPSVSSIPTPSNSRSPTPVTPLPKSPTATPSQIKQLSATPSPSISSKPNDDNGNDKVCKDYFVRGSGFKCFKRRYFVKLNNKKTARIRIEIVFNKIVTQIRGIKAAGRKFIKSVAYDYTANGFDGDLQNNNETLEKPKLSISFEFGTPVSDIKAKQSCCGKDGIIGSFRLEMCDKKGSKDRVCEMVSKIVKHKVKCKEICENEERTPKPMSDSRRCPKCVPST